MNEAFHKFAAKISKLVGSPWMFVSALTVIILWIVTGPIFHFSDTWQLVINTGTSVITFLMVFLIQNSQNREAAAMQLKLDELIRSITEARNNLVNLEEFSDEELDQLQKEFRNLRERDGSKKLDQKTSNVDAEDQRASDRLEK